MIEIVQLLGILAIGTLMVALSLTVILIVISIIFNENE